MSLEIAQKRTFIRVLGYCSDDSSLYALLALDNYFELSAFEGETFKPISQFTVAYHPNVNVQPFVHDSIIFLPAVDGRIIGLDSYSNERVVDVDLGPMSIISQPCYDEEAIYSVCAIPISNRPTTDTDIAVVCINDITSGKKRGQSCVLKGRTSPLSVGKKIWVASEKRLNRFSKEGELERTAALNFVQPYPPIVTDDKVFTFSSFGGIEIFDTDLKPLSRLMAAKNDCSPVRIGRSVLWLTEKHLFRIDLDTEKMEKLTAVTRPRGKAINSGDHIYALSGDKDILDYDIKRDKVATTTVEENLGRLVLSGKEVFVASDNEIYQLCQTTL